eukprot:TRINITY_DN6501_c0_g1_i4.p1 TRINITY_DN6501_c0_g1~~TRINITY_DN6501_c0_g1_i4.p1  ORF type:complete len:196 (+),score=21.26 TRINITY_DN6501_c0_g1_i4:92-679(+)
MDFVKAVRGWYNPHRPVTITFLDVDGVLNNSSSDITQLYVIEKKCLLELKHFIEQTSTTLVLSSTWRLQDRAKAILTEHFKSANIPLWISTTPQLASNRVEEIVTWLRVNTTFPLPTDLVQVHDENGITEEHKLSRKLEISQFVILDDMDLMQYGPESFLSQHFVRTSMATGLTTTDVVKAIHLLKQDNPSKSVN